MDGILAYRYKIVRKLGEGAFGKVYEVQHIKDISKRFCIKTEPLSRRINTLSTEKRVLKQMQNETGFPRYYKLVYFHGMRCLVIELLGRCLESFFAQAFNQLPLKTVINVTMQVLHLIQRLHEKGWIHRDVKPMNVMLGHKNKRQLYLIDFGCAKQWRSETGEHIEEVTGKPLIGTPRFASVNAHLGIELSRRDDLLSMTYVLAYLASGKLPWSRTDDVKKEKNKRYKMILKAKQQLTGTQLFRKGPAQFAQIYDYCKSLRFHDQPDYDYISGQLQHVLSQISDHESKTAKQLSYRRSITPVERSRSKASEAAAPRSIQSSILRPDQSFADFGASVKQQTAHIELQDAFSSDVASPSDASMPHVHVHPQSKSNGAYASLHNSNLSQNHSQLAHGSIASYVKPREAYKQASHDEATAENVLPHISHRARRIALQSRSKIEVDESAGVR